jgi:hypothetical protein
MIHLMPCPIQTAMTTTKKLPRQRKFTAKEPISIAASDGEADQFLLALGCNADDDQQLFYSHTLRY